MRVEATRFKVKAEKIARTQEMLLMLNERKDECLQTLYREKMYVEAIFSEIIDGQLFLTWFTIQEEDAPDVSTSGFQIDKDYLEMWEECRDRTYKPVDKSLELFLIHPKLLEKIKEIN